MNYADAVKYCREHEIYKDEANKTHFEFGDDIPEGPERRMTDMIGEPILLCRFTAEMKAFCIRKIVVSASPPSASLFDKLNRYGTVRGGQHADGECGLADAHCGRDRGGLHEDHRPRTADGGVCEGGAGPLALLLVY